MGELNKKAYEKIINEDINELNNYFPEHSLEKDHIIHVLKWSINQIYNKTMIDITKYIKELRILYPNATIEVSFSNSIEYEIHITPPINQKEHEESFIEVKRIFGDSLLERYTEETGKHFYIYQKLN